MKNSIIKTFGLIITLLLIGTFVFDINAKTLNKPTITSLKPESGEEKALRIEFNSNNSGSNYSYELVNTNTNKKNTVAGSAKFYVYQNLETNTTYKIMLRVCTNDNNLYSCSNWIKKEASISSNNSKNKNSISLITPDFKSLSVNNSNRVVLTYKTKGLMSGVEIVNITNNEKINTTNTGTYTWNKLNKGTYKFKLRIYYNTGGKIYYSDYTSNKSVTINDVNDTISVTSSYNKKINSKAFSLNAKSKLNKKLYYKSSNKEIVYVTKTGKVYPNETGNATITVYTKTDGSYKGISKKVNIKIQNRTNRPTIGEATNGNNGLGDSTGNEVKTRSWYKNNSYANWNYVFRFRNPEKAEKAADAMIEACNNNKIGYDNRSKSNSMSFTREVKKVGWKPSKVKKKCATACSQCVLTMIQISGLHRDSTNYAYKNAYSSASSLKKDKNFKTFTLSSYTKEYKKLKRGDILVDTNGKRHMIMVVK